MEKKLTFASYNMTGAKSDASRQFVNDFINCNQADIVLLQETWLQESQHDLLTEINSDFAFTATSGVDSANDLLRGRPSGGVAILWRKSLSHKISPVHILSKRLCAIEISVADTNVLLICCYMPCDSRTQNVSSEFLDAVNAIQTVVEGSNATAVIIGGDFNVDFFHVILVMSNICLILYKIRTYGTYGDVKRLGLMLHTKAMMANLVQ